MNKINNTNTITGGKNVVANSAQMDNDIKIALGTAALNLSALEWISGKYSTFICEKLLISPNDLELCATYIYVSASQSVADNKNMNNAPALELATQYVSPDLINKLAKNSSALSRFNTEIADTASKVDLTAIVIPAFEISYLWVEQLTNNIILDSFRSQTNVREIEDIDTSAFIYAYIGLTDGLECLDDVFGSGTIADIKAFTAPSSTNSAKFFADSLIQAKDWYNSLSKKKKKSFSFKAD